jgi:hypothetical protein
MYFLSFRLFLLKHNIKKIFQKYNCTPLKILGEDVPLELFMFKNGEKFSDRDISFNINELFLTNPLYENKENVNSLECYNHVNEKYQKLLNLQTDFYQENFRDGYHDAFIKNLLHPSKDNTVTTNNISLEDKKQTFSSPAANNYFPQIHDSYKDVLTEELKHGLVRVYYLKQPFNESAEIKSNHGDWKLNYSPKVFNVLEPAEGDILNSCASLCAKSFLEPLPCYTFKLYLGKEANENDIIKLSMMMNEIMNVLNHYSIKEYSKKRNNNKYRHRNDFNINNFEKEVL